MSKKRNYTYEDWLNGDIDHKKRMTLQFNVYQEGAKSVLPPEEDRKITEAQRQAFDWAVEMNLSAKKQSASRRMKKAKNPRRWLDLEIQKTQKFISEHPELDQKHEEGARELRYIDGHKYKTVQEYYKIYRQRGMAISLIETMEGGKYIPSKLQMIWEGKEYLSYLHEARKEIDGTPDEVMGPLKKVAIEMAATRKPDPELVKAALKIYVREKEANPKRSDSSILNKEISQAYEVGLQTFYKWARAYDEALKTLEGAHKQTDEQGV